MSRAPVMRIPAGVSISCGLAPDSSRYLAGNFDRFEAPVSTRCIFEVSARCGLAGLILSQAFFATSCVDPDSDSVNVSKSGNRFLIWDSVRPLLSGSPLLGLCATMSVFAPNAESETPGHMGWQPDRGSLLSNRRM